MIHSSVVQLVTSRYKTELEPEIVNTVNGDQYSAKQLRKHR